MTVRLTLHMKRVWTSNVIPCSDLDDLVSVLQVSDVLNIISKKQYIWIIFETNIENSESCITSLSVI